MFPIENWPYSNFHDLNLDWVLRNMRDAMAKIGEALDSVEGLVAKVDKNTEDIIALGETIVRVQGEVDQKLEQVQADIQAAIAAANGYTDEEIEKLKDNLDDYIIVTDPVFGGDVPLQTALDHLADQRKTDALTAAEYDALGLTAEEYDSKQLTAYQYDYEGRKYLAPGT